MTETIKDKNSELVSKRWAHALMELACEESEISKENILENLNFISDTIDSSAELSEVITNPSVSTEEKQVIICKLFQDKVLSIVYNFIFALNLRKRLFLINEITKEFAKELDVINNVKHVSITSAIELNDSKKDEIKNKIASKLNANIDVNWETNNEIIAGLIFNIDETVIDNSIRQKLDDLSKSIIH